MAAKKDCLEKYLSDQGEGQDVFRLMLEQMAHAVMSAEVQRHLGAGAYERSEERRGHRNGMKGRTLKTRVGELALAVPQVRGMAPYQPSLFERWQRSERALLVACSEMYFMGVSTRKVAKVLEKMAGFEVSATTVSKVASELDEQLREFRERPLHDRQWPYLMVDATYVKVRRHGRVVGTAVLVVVGFDHEGNREILTWKVGDAESEQTWGEVFVGLKARGLKGVELLISDAHQGIRKALARHLAGSSWQRCRVHFMRNCLAAVGQKDKLAVGSELRQLFKLDGSADCRAAAEEMAARWEGKAPRLANLVQEGFEDCLAVHEFPSNLRRRLNSTNLVERVMREIKRRTDVVGIFPNEASLDRLIGAHLLERHEQWLCEGKRYIVLEEAVEEAIK